MADTLYCMNCKHPQPKPYTSRRRYRCSRCNGLVCHHCINRDIPARCYDAGKCELRRREAVRRKGAKAGD